jgi:hypothetical protein
MVAPNLLVTLVLTTRTFLHLMGMIGLITHMKHPELVSIGVVCLFGKYFKQIQKHV